MACQWTQLMALPSTRFLVADRCSRVRHDIVRGIWFYLIKQVQPSDGQPGLTAVLMSSSTDCGGSFPSQHELSNQLLLHGIVPCCTTLTLAVRLASIAGSSLLSCCWCNEESERRSRFLRTMPVTFTAHQPLSQTYCARIDHFMHKYFHTS